jgi:glycosyltransferase involved in cell wall biosynthesis
MGERLRVLLSAYACEPDRGSEPEVGWQWALQMARFHDVTVLTRANNEAQISAVLRDLPVESAPKFIYHDLPPAWLRVKKRFQWHTWYYRHWQRSAWDQIHRLVKDGRFDLLHHVTYAAFRYEPAIFGHGLPTIWGPVGGMEAIPWPLLPWARPADLLPELARNSSNFWQIHTGALVRKARAATVVLASTRETQARFLEAGIEAPLFPTVGLDLEQIPKGARARGSTLRLLYAGNLISLKGLDLALEALAASGTKATFTLVGDGPMAQSLCDLAGALGLQDRVQFRARVTRAEMLNLYRDFDVLLFPSLHDSGGFAVLEAMASGCPVICVDCGGPGVAVTPECGTKVSPGSRSEVIAGLAKAIAYYDREPESLVRQGLAARARVAQEYAWERKGVTMARYYRQTVGERE